MEPKPRIRLFTLLGLFLACLIAGAYIFYIHRFGGDTPRASAFSPEDTIRVETLTRKHAANDRTITANNPADPVRDETLTVFYTFEGELEISQFKSAPPPGRRPTLRFIPQRRRGVSYRYYQDPMAAVAAIADPYQHALALEAYSFIFARPMAFYNSLGMSREQATRESAARTVMNEGIAAIRRSVNEGTFHPEAMDKVMAALATYEAAPGDPTQDTGKNQAAVKVLLAAAEYGKLVLAEQEGVIKAYMQTMDGELSAEEKTRLVAAATQYAQRQAAQTTRGRAPRGPATGPAVGRPVPSP